MWKCASTNIAATFRKGFYGENKILSTKVTSDKRCNCLLKFTPVFIEHINRFFDFYKNSCRKFSKGTHKKEGAKEKKNSFLRNFDKNVFDALTWSGAFVVGYYYLQPFKSKKKLNNYYPKEYTCCLNIVLYKRTVEYFISGFGIKPFNYVLPEVRAAKSNNSDKRGSVQQSSKNLKCDEKNFSVFEKAHQKVSGVLNNWLGIQHMQSGKHEEAINFFIQSAEEENAAGIFNLGICHEKGLGTSQNFEKAAELYQKATNLGHATAMYNLGVFYIQGHGVKANINQARELFKAAAQLGQKDALNALILEKKNILGHSDKNLTMENIDNLVSELKLQFLSPKTAVDSCSTNESRDNVEEASGFDLSYFEKKAKGSAHSGDSGVLDLSP